MLVLGIDLETQGLNRGTKITEVGACLFRHDNAQRRFPDGHAEDIYQKLTEYSQICYEPDYPPQTPFIVDLTGLDDDKLRLKGVARKTAIESLVPLMRQADIIMAHNKAFDETVLLDTAKEVGVDIPTREWICTKFDVPWPKKFTCHKLSHLALDHGIMVDPKSLHRATADIDLMIQTISYYRLEDILAFARSPYLLLKAKIHAPWDDGGKQKEIVQRLGFSWERIKYLDNLIAPQAKSWIKRIKECEKDNLLASIDQCESPFEVEEIPKPWL